MNKDVNFAAIAAVFDQLAARFGSADLHDLRVLYQLPCLAIIAPTSQVLADSTAFDTLFTTLLERLRGQGFHHSAYRDLSVKTLAPTLVLAAMHWTRYRGDGTVLMCTLLGMALGGWMSGKVFDLTGSYQAAFINGIAWNLLNGAIAAWLLWRSTRPPPQASLSASAVGQT